MTHPCNLLATAAAALAEQRHRAALAREEHRREDQRRALETLARKLYQLDPAIFAPLDLAAGYEVHLPGAGRLVLAPDQTPLARFELEGRPGLAIAYHGARGQLMLAQRCCHCPRYHFAEHTPGVVDLADLAQSLERLADFAAPKCLNCLPPAGTP